MKKLKINLLIFVLAIGVLYVAFTLIAPGIVDKSYNKISLKGPYESSENAMKLYQSLEFISDLHCDVLLWDRNIIKDHDYGHVDIPKMVKSSMALQAFTIVSKTPKNQNYDHNTDETDNVTLLTIAQAQPISAWFNLSERVIAQCKSLNKFAKISDGQFRVIHNASDLSQFISERSKNKSLTAGFLGIEGAHALEGDLKNIDYFYEAGVRMVGLSHFFDNELGGSAHGTEKYGITELGKKALQIMEEKNMLIDLSHASIKLVDDVLRLAKNPIIVSHTGVKGTCDRGRNLSDNHVKKIAAGGGLIGIAMFPEAVCGTDLASTARSIKYTIDLVGIDHVALGSDFDGAVTAHTDITGLPILVEELITLGLSNQEIKQVMGENVKRFLLKNLPQS